MPTQFDINVPASLHALSEIKMRRQRLAAAVRLAIDAFQSSRIATHTGPITRRERAALEAAYAALCPPELSPPEIGTRSRQK